jgi:starvation-inducible DNA-binding protein
MTGTSELVRREDLSHRARFRVFNELAEWIREPMIDLLNSSLADCIDLALQAKQAHWNVKGPSFFSLHQLFEQVHAAVFGFADQLAERIAALGGIANGTLREVAARSTLSRYPVEILDGRAHVETLARALANFGQTAQLAVQRAEEVGDRGTADLFTEISRGIDHQLWLVESHIYPKSW